MQFKPYFDIGTDDNELVAFAHDSENIALPEVAPATKGRTLMDKFRGSEALLILVANLFSPARECAWLFAVLDWACWPLMVLPEFDRFIVWREGRRSNDFYCYSLVTGGGGNASVLLASATSNEGISACGDAARMNPAQ